MEILFESAQFNITIFKNAVECYAKKQKELEQKTIHKDIDNSISLSYMSQFF